MARQSFVIGECLDRGNELLGRRSIEPSGRHRAHHVAWGDARAAASV